MKPYRLWTLLWVGLGVSILLILLTCSLPLPALAWQGGEGQDPPASSAVVPAPRTADQWTDVREDGSPATAGDESASLTAPWWAAVQEDLHHREYHVTWQESAIFPGGPPGYQAPNRAHDLRIGFYSAGIRVVPRVGLRPAWNWGLALTGFGAGEALQPLPERAPIPQTNRVEYRRGPVTEWYVNDERGLEQGFRILDPAFYRLPHASCLFLELAVTGDLTPRLVNDDQSVEWTTAGGAPVLRYGFPRATDAAGRSLPARMELLSAPHASRLRVVVDSSGAVYPLTLRLTIAALPPAADWVGESDQDGARLGYALSTAGDVNGDGYSDLIVGAPWYDGGQPGEGAAFVYHGSSTGLGAAPVWSAEGDQPDAHFGHALSIAGDVNADGYVDVVVGAPGYDVAATTTLTDAGQAYVFHGSAAGLGPSAAWSAGGDQPEAGFGYAVGLAGDVNGDRYSDVIIGVPGHDITPTVALTGEGRALRLHSGRACVFHGSAAGLDAGAGWCAGGDQPGARFGAAVSTAGDVDGDGYADVIVGAPGCDITATTPLTDVGCAYVYPGSEAGLAAGPAAWMAAGDQASAEFGHAVSTAGDVNGDSYADVLVGAPGYGGEQGDEGAAFAYLGGPAGLAASFAWAVHPTDQESAHFGAAVSVAGDVNGDGYADVVVGAPDYDAVQPDEGAAFAYYGGPTGLTTVPAWSAHPTAQQEARFGAAVSAAGDVNGDGHSDLVIGATGYDHEQNDEGGAFVYHGSPVGLAFAPTWDTVGGQAGVLLGWAVSTAGDVDGDGYADVLIGAPRYDHGQAEEGVAFLYVGGPDGLATSPAWMGEGDQEWAWFGSAVATAGDVDNDGYADVIVGAPRYDGEQLDDGKAFVYHGGPGGLAVTPAWVAPPAGQGTARFGISARFGTAAATAGDVNGDGYADVVVTANGFDAEGTNEGAAFVYHGGPAGLAAEPAWTAHPTDQAYANFGRSAATAGDVNGDGYSDVVVGAPWYDYPQTEQELDGTAFVYHGSAVGLSLDPEWTVTDVFTNAEFGISVSTAGDVDGDGYSDVIIGAYRYTGDQWQEGAAFAYHGGPEGLAASPAWSARGGQEQAKFGLSVSTAGDVNGDGYGDVVVGAHHYADGQSYYGLARAYHGGPEGLLASPAWSVEGDQDGGGYGFAVSTAGDVNGDGYGDLIVGVPAYNDGWTDEGAALVYLGNGGGGLPVCPRQLRSDGRASIAFLGRSNSANQVRLQLTARSPLGRQPVALQWQLAPLGIPFTAATAISGTSPGWSDVLTTGVVLSQTVDGLKGGTVYRWRVRPLYRPGGRTGQSGGRWVYLPWNGPQEADFRTPRLLAPDRSAKVLPGHPAVYTHTASNPIDEAQTFTLTAASLQGYTVTLTTPAGGMTVTLSAFGWSPITVTVQTPAVLVSSTQDKTIVTATSSHSGRDVVYDLTTIEPVTAASLGDVFLPLVLRYLALP